MSRRQVYELELTRAEVTAHLRAGRWQRVLSQSLAVHTGPIPAAGLMWAAVFEAGDRACLDGVSSLLAAGLQHYTEPVVRVSVPRGVLVRRGPGIDVRQTRRLTTADRVAVGVPRTKNHIAAELLRIKRDRRRILVTAVITDLLDGVRSLGEHEFALLCRERGLPEPTRQVLRRGRNRRYYLDAIWEEWGVVVEIDAIQHSWATNAVADALRHNDVALGSALVLRLPLIGLRVAADDFFEQIETALTKRGWRCGRTS